MSNVESSPPPERSVGSKSKRKRAGCFVLVGILLAGLIAAAVVFGPGLLNVFPDGQVATAPSGLDDNTSPEAMLARREAEEARLNTYAWIDKEAGVVRIPIERAMVLIAESGLPVGAQSTETAIPEEELPVVIPTSEAVSEAPSAVTPVVEGSPSATPEPAGTTEATPASEPSPAPTVDLANVSFQNNVLPIFEQHCVKCHGGERPEGGLRVEEGLKLTSYADVLAGSFNGSVIEPGDVDGSYLIDQVVTGRMPKEGPRLTPAEIEIITAWVEAGAPNN